MIEYIIISDGDDSSLDTAPTAKPLRKKKLEDAQNPNKPKNSSIKATSRSLEDEAFVCKRAAVLCHKAERNALNAWKTRRLQKRTSSKTNHASKRPRRTRRHHSMKLSAHQ